MKLVSSRGASALILMVFVAPALLAGLPPAAARPPDVTFSAPYTVSSEITGFALDAQGRYAAVVVDVDATVGTLGSTAGASDVYAFDLHGTGKIWTATYRQELRFGQIPTTQVVGFAATTGQTSSKAATFYTGGPGNTIASWNANGPNPAYSRKAEISGEVDAVAASSDGKLVAYAINSPTAGRVFIHDGETGRYRWDINITGSGDTPSKVTTMAFARSADAKLLVIGHERGVSFIDPTTSRPPAEWDFYDTSGAKVTSIDVSNDGKYVVIGASTGSSGSVYFHPMTTSHRLSPFNRGFQSGVTSVAMSADGRYFAAGLANAEVHFFQRSADASLVAEVREDPQTKATKFVFRGARGITSLDYDSVGTTLVATSDVAVAGFHVASHEPIWLISAAEMGLDVPLSGARVGDSGERVFVAGLTKVTALRSSFGGSVEVEGGLARRAVPGDTVRYNVKVTNTGSAVDTYGFVVQPKPGWIAEPVKAVTLRPEESRVLQVNLTSPTGAAPGPVETDLSVESEGLRNNPRPGHSHVLKALKLNVTLERVHNVRLEADVTAFTVDQGRDVTMPFTVKNLGNADAIVNLSAAQAVSRGSTWNLRFEPQQVTVQPGGSATVNALATAPTSAADGDVNTVTVQAKVGTTYQTDLKLTVRVNPEFKADMTANVTKVLTRAGESRTVEIRLKNLGNTADKFNLSAIVEPEAARLQWRVELDYETNVEVKRGETFLVTLTVRSQVREPTPASVTVRGITLNGGETKTVKIQLEQEKVVETEDGFFSRIPAPSPALVALALVGAAAVVGLGNRERRRGVS